MHTYAIQASVSGDGQGNFNISNNGTVANPITHIGGNVISHSALGLANVTSTISNNVIVANHARPAARSGSAPARAGLRRHGQRDADDDDLEQHHQPDRCNGISWRRARRIGQRRRPDHQQHVAAPLNGVTARHPRGFRATRRTRSTTASVWRSRATPAPAAAASQGIGLRKQGTVSPPSTRSASKAWRRRRHLASKPTSTARTRLAAARS